MSACLVFNSLTDHNQFALSQHFKTLSWRCCLRFLGNLFEITEFNRFKSLESDASACLCQLARKWSFVNFSCIFHCQLQDAVSGVRVIVTGPSQTEEEEDFPPPPPDISGLHIGENVHQELTLVNFLTCQKLLQGQYHGRKLFQTFHIRVINHFGNIYKNSCQPRQERCKTRLKLLGRITNAFFYSHRSPKRDIKVCMVNCGWNWYKSSYGRWL